MGAEATQPERQRSWDGVVRRSIDVSVRLLDDGSDSRAIEVIASDATLDSHGDKLLPYWDLSRYEKNPVVLWNHNIFESSAWSFGGACDPEDNFPIGRAENVRVEAGQLKATLVLGSAEYSDIAQKVFLGCKEKIIRAVSVGFRPGQVAAITGPDGSTSHYELGSPERPNELREISFVPMGSNPSAVIAKSIAFEREHLGRLAAERRAHAAQETDTMSMTAEEKAAYEKALADTKAATDLAAQAEGRATKAESREQLLKADLETARADLKAAQEALVKADSARVKTELDALQGVKFAPVERERLEKHVKALGLDEVVASLKERADLAVTQPVTVNGNPTRGAHQPAPPAVEGDGEQVEADFSKAVQAQMSNAAA